MNNQKKQCECCQKSYSSSYWTRHIKTQKHIRNSIPTINQEPIIKTILVIKKAPCEICSKMITITNMSRHRNIHNTPKIIEVIAELRDVKEKVMVINLRRHWINILPITQIITKKFINTGVKSVIIRLEMRQTEKLILQAHHI